MMVRVERETKFRSVVAFMVNNKVDHALTINIDEYNCSHVLIELVCKDHGQLAFMSFMNFNGAKDSTVSDIENLRNTTNIKVNRRKVDEDLFHFD
jgi:hypothetical protein